MVDTERKLGAVKGVLRGVRLENRSHPEALSIRRSEVVPELLHYFSTTTSLDRMKNPLRVTFLGESGVDEGGLLSELFTVFFDRVLDPAGGSGLFESSSNNSSSGSSGSSGGSGRGDQSTGQQVLPSSAAHTPEALQNLRAFGRTVRVCVCVSLPMYSPPLSSLTPTHTHLHSLALTHRF